MIRPLAASIRGACLCIPRRVPSTGSARAGLRRARGGHPISQPGVSHRQATGGLPCRAPRRLFTTAAMALSYPEPTVFESNGPHKATVIILHGLGDTADGWASLAGMFAMPGAKFIFPTAPMRPITLNMGMVMTGWYDINSLDKINATEDEDGIRESWRFVEEIIAKEEASGLPSSNIVVGGFSQGGAVALMAARSKKKLGGIIGLSTYVPLRSAPEGVLSEENRCTPILMCHGERDMVINFNYGMESYKLLEEAGASVEFKKYLMGHEANIEELEEVKSFIGNVVKSAE